MPEWKPFEPPRVWQTPGVRGEPDYDLELFEPDLNEEESAALGRYGLAVGAYFTGSFLFLVEVWTKDPSERSSLEQQATAQAIRMIQEREWIRRPDSRHPFWLYRGGTASRRMARRKPCEQGGV